MHGSDDRERRLCHDGNAHWSGCGGVAATIGRYGGQGIISCNHVRQEDEVRRAIGCCTHGICAGEEFHFANDAIGVARVCKNGELRRRDEDSAVGWAEDIDGRRGRVCYSDCLAALGAVTAGIGRHPGAGRAERIPTGRVGDGADDGNGGRAALVRGSWRIKVPGVALFDSFVGLTANDRRGGVHDGYRLIALRTVATSIGRHPDSGCAESIATGRICHCANYSDCGGAMGYGAIEGPGRAALHSFVGSAAAVHHWSARVHYRDLLATRAAVAAGIGGLPGASRIEGAAAVASHVGDCAQDRDGGAGAVVGRRRRIESPGGALFHSLVRAAARNDRSGRIHHGDRLTARTAVAAGVGGLPDAGRIKGTAAMTGHIGHSAENRNCGAAAVISGGRRIEGPGRALLDRLIGAAARNHWRGCVHHGHFLAALREVAAGIGGLPGTGGVKGGATVTRHVGYGAEY